MYDNERYQLARARVQQLHLFYTHVGVYVFVNILLLLINLLTDPSSLWFYWPLLGWGIAVAAHAFLVFGVGGIMERNGRSEESGRFWNRRESGNLF